MVGRRCVDGRGDRAESLGRLDGVAAGGVSLTTEEAVLRAPGAAEAYVGSATVGVSTSLDVHAGSSLGVSTGVLSLSVEGGVEAVSGAEVALRSESMEVESSTSLSVSTQDAVCAHRAAWRATCRRA